MSYKLRFWVEHWSPKRIVAEAYDLISSYKPGLNIAIFPDSLTDENISALQRLIADGIEISFWVLLGAEEGYFPNEKNMSTFCSRTEEIISKALEASAAPKYVAIDLEMPISQVVDLLEASSLEKIKRAYRIFMDNLDRSRFSSARADLAELVQWLHSKEIKTIAAVLPWVILELEGEGNLLQNAMETPVRGIDWDILSPMWYSSMFEGSTGGIISQGIANRIAFESSLKLRSRYGDRVGISVGVTGTGILGNEKTFGDVEELLDSIGAALSAGVRDISVYNLEGVITREDPGLWMTKMISAKPRVPDRKIPVSMALWAARFFYRVFGEMLEK